MVVTDLTRPLREEELKAWQRLVRVLGHELNNSLTPIKSIAGSLESILARQPRPEDWEDDTRKRPGRDRGAQRSPEPLYERLCDARQTAPADHGAGGRGGTGAARREIGNAHHGRSWSPVPRS